MAVPHAHPFYRDITLENFIRVLLRTFGKLTFVKQPKKLEIVILSAVLWTMECSSIITDFKIPRKQIMKVFLYKIILEIHERSRGKIHSLMGLFTQNASLRYYSKLETNF